jgi:hypothetical protein
MNLSRELMERIFKFAGEDKSGLFSTRFGNTWMHYDALRIKRTNSTVILEFLYRNEAVAVHTFYVQSEDIVELIDLQGMCKVVAK